MCHYVCGWRVYHKYMYMYMYMCTNMYVYMSMLQVWWPVWAVGRWSVVRLSRVSWHCICCHAYHVNVLLSYACCGRRLCVMLAVCHACCVQATVVSILFLVVWACMDYRAEGNGLETCVGGQASPWMMSLSHHTYLLYCCFTRNLINTLPLSLPPYRTYTSILCVLMT